MSDSSFSFKELREARKLESVSPEFIAFSDGVRLYYRRYIPPEPRAVVLFYHGGGHMMGWAINTLETDCRHSLTL
jgi:acetyl esterase/lipase